MVTDSKARRVAVLDPARFLGWAGRLAAITDPQPERLMAMLRVCFGPRDFEITASDGALRAARYRTTSAPERFDRVYTLDPKPLLAARKAWAGRMSAQLFAAESGLTLWLVAGHLQLELRPKMAPYPDIFGQWKPVLKSLIVVSREELLGALNRLPDKTEVVRLEATLTGLMVGRRRVPTHLQSLAFNVRFNAHHLREALFNIDDDDVRFSRGKLMYSAPVLVTGREDETLQYLLTPLFDDTER